MNTMGVKGKYEGYASAELDDRSAATSQASRRWCMHRPEPTDAHYPAAQLSGTSLWTRDSEHGRWAFNVSDEGTQGVFAVAYVILPFSDTRPAEAIGISLARFQRGRRGDLPEKWLAFDDETEALRRVYEAHLTFIEKGTGGLQIKGDEDVAWCIDIGKVKKGGGHLRNIWRT
jgi:hypothetical protein